MSYFLYRSLWLREASLWRMKCTYLWVWGKYSECSWGCAGLVKWVVGLPLRSVTSLTPDKHYYFSILNWNLVSGSCVFYVHLCEHTNIELLTYSLMFYVLNKNISRYNFFLNHWFWEVQFAFFKNPPMVTFCYGCLLSWPLFLLPLLRLHHTWFIALRICPFPINSCCHV